MECPHAVQMHGKHEPCRDTTHLGTDAFLQHLQGLPGYADQACSLSLRGAGCDIDLGTGNTSITSILPCESPELHMFHVIYKGYHLIRCSILDINPSIFPMMIYTYVTETLHREQESWICIIIV